MKISKTKGEEDQRNRFRYMKKRITPRPPRVTHLQCKIDVMLHPRYQTMPWREAFDISAGDPRIAQVKTFKTHSRLRGIWGSTLRCGCINCAWQNGEARQKDRDCLHLSSTNFVFDNDVLREKCWISCPFFHQYIADDNPSLMFPRGKGTDSTVHGDKCT